MTTEPTRSVSCLVPLAVLLIRFGSLWQRRPPRDKNVTVSFLHVREQAVVMRSRPQRSTAPGVFV